MTADHEGAVAAPVLDAPATLSVPTPRAPQRTRDRIIDVAVELTCEIGWSGVTMGRLADRAGVSRQTVYNEVGRKDALAEAMILREVARFLDCVSVAFAEHDDLLAAVEAATRAVLEQSSDNRLMRAIVGATHGADTELLPYLAGHSAGLIGVARDLIRDCVAPFEIPLDDEQRDVAIDTIVRVVLSHTMQPGASPEQVAADIAWITRRILQLP